MNQAIGTIQTGRLTNSTNGNPRYRVVFVSAERDEKEAPVHIVDGNTSSDSQFVYSMPRSGLACCTWRVTPSGRVVFTDISRTGV